MPLLPCNQAPDELLSLFNTDKESILARCYEPEPGLFIAESAKVTFRALNGGYEIIAMLIEDTQMNQEAQELISRLPDIPVYYAPSQQFREISGYPMTRGVLSLFRRKYRSRPDTHETLALHPVFRNPNSRGSIRDTDSSEESLFQGQLTDTNSHSPEKSLFERPFSKGFLSPTIEEFLLSLTPAASQRFAVLEEVANPANIGSIFRNAAALGIDAVLLTKGCCDPLARRCLRVSMGCVFQVPWCMTGLTGAQIAGTLRTQGIHTAAMALSDDSVSITDPVLKTAPRLAIFLGNEGNGLPEETIRACDSVVRIPMRDGVDSLNVAAASAVAFWELR